MATMRRVNLPPHPRPWRALAAALLLATGALAQASVDTRAARYHEDALQRFERNDHAGAVIQLRNALRIDNRMLAVHVLLGRALLADGDAAAAEAAFAEALRLGVSRAEVVVPMAHALIAQGRQPDLERDARFTAEGLPPATRQQVLLLQAAARADLGDSRGALQRIDAARALDPRQVQSWLAEVPVRLRARELREATAAAERALALEPASAEAHYLRGTIAHLQGDAQAALERYARALQLAPAHTEALVSRAGLLIDRGRHADARRDVDELLRAWPRDPRGAYLSALLAEQAGRRDEARAALQRVTAILDPVPLSHLRFRPQALMLGGLAHFGLNQRERALAYLVEAHRAQPGTGVAKLIAQIEIANGNAERAIDALEAYLRHQPRDTQALLLLASAHLARGNHGRATQLLQQALRQGERADLRTLLGLSLIGGGRFGDAVAELEAAWRKDPRQTQAGIGLATLYVHAGQAQPALRVTRALLPRHGNDPGVHNLHGMALGLAGDAAGARQAFERALQLDAAFGAPQINLARLDLAQRRHEPAQARLEALLRRDDRNLEAMLELARVHEQQGRLPQAQRMLERADEVGGAGDFSAALALVDLHLRHGRPDAAREASRRLATKAPDAMPVLLAQARVSLAQGDAAAARSTLARASGRAGFNAGALLQIALLQSQTGDLAGAAHSLGKALDQRPDLLPAQALLAEVEWRQGQLAQAEQRARQIVARQPRAALGHGLLGDIAMARGQAAAAAEAFRRAHQLEPGSASLLRLHAALDGSDSAAAARLAEDWLRQHPRDLGVHRALADGHARAGRYPAARRAYEALLALAPTDANALNNLAHVLLRLGDAGALPVAERALASAPGTPHVLGTAGWAAWHAGQPERALQLLRDARLRDPTNPTTRYYLATVLAATSRQAEAREELQAALQAGSAFEHADDARQLLRTLR